MAAGAEIRFVLLGPSARLTLSAEGLQEFQPTAHVFFGPLAGRPHVHPIGTEPTTIDVGIGDDQRPAYESIPDDLAAAMPFHPRVVRVVLFRGVFRLHDVQGDLRPPAAAELPELTMLSYGTSITHGSVATAFHLTYVAQAAWRLGVDLINLGVGGACLCEPAFGEYIGARPDWDVATPRAVGEHDRPRFHDRGIYSTDNLLSTAGGCTESGPTGVLHHHLPLLR